MGERRDSFISPPPIFFIIKREWSWYKLDLRNYYHSSSLYGKYNKLRNSKKIDKLTSEDIKNSFRNAGAGASKFYQRSRPEPREDFSPLNAVEIPSLEAIIAE